MFKKTISKSSLSSHVYWYTLYLGKLALMSKYALFVVHKHPKNTTHVFPIQVFWNYVPGLGFWLEKKEKSDCVRFKWKKWFEDRGGAGKTTFRKCSNHFPSHNATLSYWWVQITAETKELKTCFKLLLQNFSVYHWSIIRKLLGVFFVLNSPKQKTLEWDSLNPDRLIWVSNVNTFDFLLNPLFWI